VAGPSTGAGMESFILILIMLGVFYFLLIRPQQKRQKKHTSLLKALKAGDEVITSSGIFGKITEMQGGTITVEIAKNTKIRVLKNYVAGLATKDTEQELADAPR
jgi:preprotein translocase subunit YajC